MAIKKYFCIRDDKLFDFKLVQKSAARLDINKMQWLNKILSNATASLVTEMQWHLEQQIFQRQPQRYAANY